MSKIKDYLTEINKSKKALSVYLTAGFPRKENFEELVLRTFEAGADLIELGIPFSDPLADGKTIQASSQTALDNGVNTEYVLETTAKVKEKTDRPVIIMTYANPVLNYGVDRFLADSLSAGVDGLIVPDLPLEESEEFFKSCKERPDVILLTTPASPAERIRKIDQVSEGFLYCVSVLGTTGAREGFTDDILEHLERTYGLVSNNKMLVGFGISSPEDIRKISPYCDGVIIGSAVIKSLSRDSGNYSETMEFVKSLNEGIIDSG